MCVIFMSDCEPSQGEGEASVSAEDAGHRPREVHRLPTRWVDETAF